MKELLVFTRQYPRGNGEVFLTHALRVWQRCFSRVRVFPMFRGEGELPLPEGVEVVDLWPEGAYRSAAWAASMAHVPALSRLVLAYKADDGTGWRERLSRARQILHRAQVVRKQLLSSYDPARTQLLSVWMEDWVDVLGTALEGIPGARFTAMAHRWDLYEHQRPAGVIPYRDRQMAVTDRIIAISQRGAEHLRQRYPQHADKVVMHHLGTSDHGIAPWHPGTVLRVVSCSSLRPPKRVRVIAEALARVRRPVRWTHFGDGPDRAGLEEALRDLPGHVSVRLAGQVSNAGLMRWYQENPADLFLHMSDSEGLPVVLQEAISFGIPVIANDVDGVGELVGPSTGLLLPATPDPSGLAEVLDGPGPDTWCTETFRAGVRKFWEERFQAEVNYARMAGRF